MNAARLIVLLLLTAIAVATQAQDTAPGADERAVSYTQFRQLFDAGNYPEAIPIAQRIAEQTEARLGTTDPELQVALMNLAATQSLAGDPTGAEANYMRVIGLIESEGRMSSPRLARAQAGLANVYYQAKRHDVAVVAYERALSQSRRTEGLFNTDQIPLLTSYAESLTQLGRYEDALRAQEYGLRIAERQYGENDPRVAPVLESIGRWYAKLGVYDLARQKLRRAMQIVERAKGENDLGLVGPLTGLADTYRRQSLDPDEAHAEEPAPSDARSVFDEPSRLPLLRSTPPSMMSSEGLRALERANAIVAASPDATPLLVVDTRTQLGDWYQTRLQHERALPHYQQAWRAAGGLKQAGKPLVDLLFGQPVLLHYIRPPSADRLVGRPAEQLDTKFVEVELDVNEQGRVHDPRLLSNQGTERMSVETLDAAATARYRPRFVDGQPVATEKVVFRQGFRVLAGKSEDAAPPQAPPTS